MNRHASMNRIFRLVWNESLNAYVPAAETARGRGKSSKRKLIAAVLSLSATIAQAGPTGGQVTGGSGTITQSGATTTIQQASQNLSLNWQTFNIAPQETVNFVQPNASAIAVNRILDPNGSVILGHLNANGQVYLINPNGVLFGKGAEVNVGGLVASALNLNDGTIGDAAKTFSGTGSGSVVNDGTLNAAAGGTVALLGNHVSNTGVISAQLGTVALGAGSAATLTFRGTRLVSLQIDRSVLNSVAANGGLINGDGGQVLMSAGAQKALLASVVNNTGIIEARTFENHQGTITLLGGMAAGTVNVAGTLDASAPNGGNGGFIETSAAHVEVADSARVTTAAAKGLTGSWLADPVDFTIAASGGDITGATLSGELATTNVSLSSVNGASGTLGNLNVNDAVSLSINKLTLTAVNNVNINAVVTATGAASLDLEPGSGNVNVALGANGFTGRVDFSGTGALTINNHVYTVINSLGSGPSSTMSGTLQGMQANLSGYYALGSNIDATPTGEGGAWSSAGFAPIGIGSSFAGSFDGLGHTITGLSINLPSLGSYASLIAKTDSGSIVRNVGLINPTVVGDEYAATLVGSNYGTVSNTFASGGSVTANYASGGLVGGNYGSIRNSYAATAVTGTNNGDYIGGLVGFSGNGSAVSSSYATGNVSGSSSDYYVGGLIGLNYGNVDGSHATGAVTGYHYIGGLIGQQSGATVSNSYATGAVSGPTSTGGLVGKNIAGAISGSHATGAVTGSYYTGGLVGNSSGGTIGTSYATGAITGSDYVGGLVGYGTASITASHATGNASGLYNVGGLVGQNRGSITQSFANGNVNASLLDGTGYGDNVRAGGLVGANFNATISDSYATGNVTIPSNGGAGGLAGRNYGASSVISNSFATGTVSGATNSLAGGLIGHNFSSAVVSNSFYLSSANSSLQGIGGAADAAGTVIGLNSAQMKTGANFTSSTAANGNVNPGWDFNNTWFQYDGNTTPLLQVFMTPLTVSGTVTQTYNGAVFAPTISNLTYSIVPDASHLFGTVTIAGSAVGASHAGTYSFTPGGMYSDQLGYMISYSAGSLTINPAPLTVVGSTANKVYDGTTVAPLTGGTLVGVVGGDTVNLAQAGTFASKNVGTGISITANDTIGGASAGDYTLVEPTGVTGTITPAPLTVSGTTVGGKVYNGTTAAALSGGSLVGVIGGDTVTLTQAGSFASKNAGTGIAVTAADSLGGSDASDYTIVEPTGLAGTITPATLTVSGTTVGAKTYNGSTAASLTGGSLVGVVSGDTVTLNQSGTFASAGVGSGIAVTATDSLSGTSAFDYSITEPTGLTGSILPASNPPSSASGLVLAALNARTQIVENFIYPQLGANPQVIDPLPTIAVLATSAESASEGATGSHQAIAVNVSMKIGANGTLKIENGGLRLPSNLVVGNE